MGRSRGSGINASRFQLPASSFPLPASSFPLPASRFQLHSFPRRLKPGVESWDAGRPGSWAAAELAQLGAGSLGAGSWKLHEIRQCPDLGGRALAGFDRAVHVTLPLQAACVPPRTALDRRDAPAKRAGAGRTRDRTPRSRRATSGSSSQLTVSCRDESRRFAQPGQPTDHSGRSFSRDDVPSAREAVRRRAGSGCPTARAVLRRRPRPRRSGRSEPNASGRPGRRQNGRSNWSEHARGVAVFERGDRARCCSGSDGSNATSRSVEAGSAATQKSASSSRRVPRSSIVTRTAGAVPVWTIRRTAACSSTFACERGGDRLRQPIVAADDSGTSPLCPAGPTHGELIDEREQREVFGIREEESAQAADAGGQRAVARRRGSATRRRTARASLRAIAESHRLSGQAVVGDLVLQQARRRRLAVGLL